MLCVVSGDTEGGKSGMCLLVYDRGLCDSNLMEEVSNKL